jgi:hypothetical protein
MIMSGKSLKVFLRSTDQHLLAVTLPAIIPEAFLIPMAGKPQTRALPKIQ